MSNTNTKAPTLEEHLRAWGLRGAPFAPDEKSSAIFPADSHRGAHDLLDSTAALRGVMLLTGAPGSGKSTLLKTWMRGLSVQRALFTRISATAALDPLARQDIALYLNWQVSRAGLERDIFEPAAVDLLAEASQGNPRTLNLLAQAAWLAAARSTATTIHPEHIHSALRQVPAASAKTTNP